MKTKKVISLVIVSLFSVLLSAGIGEANVKSIKNDASGGDCQLIGNWDFESKTCTLTRDVEAVEKVLKA